MTTARSLLAPEVIQTSTMDCGPASLKSVLQGFGIEVGYGRLREACATDVDGTSIDTLEDVAIELGLEAEQIMVPLDHLLQVDAEAAPAILVVQQPHAPTHFIVLWRVTGGWVQVMDPGVGRRWLRREALLREVYRHQMQVPAEDWRGAAESETFLRPLSRRLASVGVRRSDVTRLVTRAIGDATWSGLATLDAATRMTERLVRSGGVDAGRDATRLVERLATADPYAGTIAEPFWSVRPASAGTDGEPQLSMRGAVLVRAAGRVSASRATVAGRTVAPELLAALKAPTRTAWVPFLAALRVAGPASFFVAALSLAASAATVLLQALLFRSAFDIGYWLGISEQRLGAFGALAVFLGAALLLDYPITSLLQRYGRRLEISMRVVLARKIPRTADRYFHSRLLSDLTERAHSVGLLRELPMLVAGLLQSAFQLALTAAGVLWLAAELRLWVIVTVVTSMALALVSVFALQEREMRVRSHGGTLVRFYFDALLGVSAVRAHGAGAALAREQESILVQWSSALRRFLVAGVVIELVQALLGAGLAVALVTRHAGRADEAGGVLLVTYWALQLPALAQSLALTARRIPSLRNALARVLEPLSAPEETEASEADAADSDAPPATARHDLEAPSAATRLDALSVAGPRCRGVHIELEDVTVRAGGHDVLRTVSLDIPEGSQVAVVGASGSGKSTLIGLFLGWFTAGSGQLRLDGAPLTSRELSRWRRHTAWVDPAVQIFNDRFANNLLYGAEDAAGDIAGAVDATELREVLERLPDGLQTVLGEGGALVSGGEGQRVRLGRAWLRRDVRLVLLDEPFRGLGRGQRRDLLERARSHWSGATMLCATHDMHETLGFARVLVVEGGRIVEDGDPRALATDVRSRYHAMLTAEQFVQERFWGSSEWRRVRVDKGTIQERDEVEPPSMRLLAEDLEDRS